MSAIVNNIVKNGRLYTTQKEIIQAFSDLSTCAKCETIRKVIVLDFAYLVPDNYKLEVEGNPVKLEVNRPHRKFTEWGSRMIIECACNNFHEISVSEIEHNRLVKYLKGKAGIPDEYKNASIINWEKRPGTEELTENVLIYLENWEDFKADGIGLLIYSSTCGNGKSFITACIAHDLIKKGYSVKFCVVGDLLTRIRQSYDNKNNTETENMILNELYSCDLLILDDVGVEKWSDWVEEKLFQIVNNRYNSIKPFIMTTNCTLDELKNQLKGDFSKPYYESDSNESKKDRLLSRILKKCVLIENKSTDKRLEDAVKTQGKIIEFKKRVEK